jgi:hypothetical protein
VLVQDNITHTEGDQAQYYGSGGGNADSIGRLAAYAYVLTKKPAFAQMAISRVRVLNASARELDGPLVLNPIEESGIEDTNEDSQASLTDIEVLAMCADQLPTEAPAPVAGRGAGRRGGGGAAPAAGGRGGPGASAAAGNTPAAAQ